MAAPFALSLILALALGPTTIDSAHGSFPWLVGASSAAAILIFTLRGGWLAGTAVLTLLVFPVTAGLGFNFAPSWAKPLVILVFYGSVAASVAAIGVGIALIGMRFRLRWRALGTAIASVALGAAVLLVGAAARSPIAAQGLSDTSPVNMGPVINGAHREAEPSFVGDGRTMYFNCDDSDICVSRLIGAWDAGGWTAPELLGAPISTDYTEVEPWISATGDKLYFNSSRPFARGESLPGLSIYVDAIGLIAAQLGTNLFAGLGQDEIWVSYREGGVWSEPRNLNDVAGEPPVNTEFADHCLAFSADGNEAFWTSTRPGGFGGNDIWTSRRVGGTWTPPENLGPNVNSSASEHHAMPSPDGRSLYVTSDRAGGFGGEDNYITTRGTDGAWGPLINVGPPVNGPANDRCPVFTPDGTVLLFDSDRAGGFGSKDIWWISYDASAVSGRLE